MIPLAKKERRPRPLLEPRPRGAAEQHLAGAPYEGRSSKHCFCCKGHQAQVGRFRGSKYLTLARRPVVVPAGPWRGWSVASSAFRSVPFLSNSQNLRPNHIGPTLSSIPAESACRHNGRPILGEISLRWACRPVQGLPRAGGHPASRGCLGRRTHRRRSGLRRRDGRRALILTQASGCNQRPAMLTRRFVLVEFALCPCRQIQRRTHRDG